MMVINLDLSKVKASPELLKELEVMHTQLLSLERHRRANKGLDKSGLLTALGEALQREPKGRNAAFVQLFEQGFEYEDGQKVDPEDLKESFAKVLEDCPGVSVDRATLKMSDQFGQWVLRVYNRPEVGLITKRNSEAN